MAAQENYYDILGVAHDADAKTIKRAFLKKLVSCTLILTKKQMQKRNLKK